MGVFLFWLLRCCGVAAPPPLPAAPLWLGVWAHFISRVEGTLDSKGRRGRRGLEDKDMSQRMTESYSLCHERFWPFDLLIPFPLPPLGFFLSFCLLPSFPVSPHLLVSISTVAARASAIRGGRTPKEAFMEGVMSEIDKMRLEARLGGDVEPLVWWRQKQQRDRYPYLHLVAVLLLSIPATSAEVERLFSSCGNVITERRASLDRNRFQKMIMIKKNWDDSLYKISRRQKDEREKRREEAQARRSKSAAQGAQKRKQGQLQQKVLKFFRLGGGGS